MRKLALWFGLLVLGGSGVANGTVIYDANQYFAGNELAAETNPFGPFSVGHFDEAILGGFTPFTSAEHTNSFRDFNAGKIQGYFIDNDPDAPGVLVNVDSVNSVVTDFGTTLEPLQIHLHPGGIGTTGRAAPLHNAILRFTAPFSGDYDIEGGWESLHGGLTRKMVLHNGLALLDTTTAVHDFSYAAYLDQGDSVDFVVNAVGDIGEDSTGLYATMTFIPEPSTAILLGLGLVGMAARRRV